MRFKLQIALLVLVVLAILGLSACFITDNPFLIMLFAVVCPWQANVSASMPYELTTSPAELPLTFERNIGQSSSAHAFLARGQLYNVLLGPTGASVLLRGAVETGPSEFELRLSGANPAARAESADALPGRVNYFLGDDPSQWRSGIPTFRHVRFRNIYPGVDVEYYGRDAQLENDFVVAPGADPAVVKVVFAGADSLALQPSGDLTVRVGDAELLWKKPYVYQRVGGEVREVASAYRLQRGGEVGFDLAAYDSSRALVIDPVLDYSSFLGRGQDESATRVTVDASGASYITGVTSSIGFPAFPHGRFGPTASKGSAFVTKVNAAGDAIMFSTYFGGGKTDVGQDIAIDSQGGIYVAGSTNSDNFPVTADAFQSEFVDGEDPAGEPAEDAFLVKLSASGDELLYATYLGGSGSDGAMGLALDDSGACYLTGATTSRDFPVTSGAMQSSYRGSRSIGGLESGDVFVTKLRADGSPPEYSTFYGGRGNEAGFAIDIDASGSAYVAGFTGSPDLPLTEGAYRSTYERPILGAFEIGEAFVMKLNPAGTASLYSTFLGGRAEDGAFDIVVLDDGSAVVAGATNSADFAVTAGAAQRAYGGGGGDRNFAIGDGFVAKLNPAGTDVVFATYFGGSQGDRIFSLAVGDDGLISIGGNTLSEDLPVTADAALSEYSGSGQQIPVRFGDGFVAQLSADGGEVLYSSYAGGATDDVVTGVAAFDGAVYAVGNTTSTDFPTAGSPFQDSYGGGTNLTVFPHGDAFAARFGEINLIAINALLSGASFRGGAVAPGEVVALFTDNAGPQEPLGVALSDGVVATERGGLRILFDGDPAPLLFVSATQQVAVAPYSLAGKDEVEIRVEWNGELSPPLMLPVAEARPALFTFDSSGAGQAAALNQDGSFNTTQTAAPAGSIVVFYGTGHGQTNPAGEDGSVPLETLPQPLEQVAVTIGGLEAEVLYAGAAPGLVAGALQLNVKLPGGLSPGEHEVIVTIGEVSSPAGVTVAVAAP